MKLPDVNLVLYAVDSGSALHRPAKSWLEKILSGAETVGWSWVVLLGFIRLSTNPRVFSSPLTVDQAISHVDGWLKQSCSTVVHPTDRHLAVLADLLSPLGTGGNLTNDAHLAALAIEHGADLCSADLDFARFKGLTWSNPIG